MNSVLLNMSGQQLAALSAQQQNIHQSLLPQPMAYDADYPKRKTSERDAFLNYSSPGQTKKMRINSVSSSASSPSTATFQKEHQLSRFGLLPPMSKCNPCNPAEGLTLGGRPITLDDLVMLTPDDLEEHILEQNGEPVSEDKLAGLLGFGDENNSSFFQKL